MADFLTPKERSIRMSRVRGKNTRAELIVFKYLRRQGIYFQKHYRSHEGIVMDIALPRKKRAVFIDGDFWHGRSVEKLASRRGEDDFWTKKLRRNMERDKQQAWLLVDAGWQILRVWESELTRKSTREITIAKIQAFLERGK